MEAKIILRIRKKQLIFPRTCRKQELRKIVTPLTNLDSATTNEAYNNEKKCSDLQRIDSCVDQRLLTFRIDTVTKIRFDSSIQIFNQVRVLLESIRFVFF